MDEPFACEVGTALWQAYRAQNPGAPIEPSACPEELPEAVAFWEHSSKCDNCNEYEDIQTTPGGPKNEQ
jgi:hypothetical protein